MKQDRAGTAAEPPFRARGARLALVGSFALALFSFAPALAQQAPPQQRPPAAAQPQARPGAPTQGQRPPAGQPPAPAAGEIRGQVIDAQSNARIGSASVSLRARADGPIVAGAIARGDGSFVIAGLRPGTYLVRVSMMGYTPQSTTLTVTAAAPTVNAGVIRLARSAVALAGITATGARQAVSIAPDRNTYSARTVAPGASNASEVLEATPSVQVDADGRVSLRGNENVVVQINGRPSPLTGDQLAGYLKQLPANTLDRVEVIPNPSAKQDPEGMAGIINIVLKQNVDLGLSGGATLSASTNDRYTASGNLGYQVGPVTLFGSYGFSSSDRAEHGVNDRTRLLSGSAASFTNQLLHNSAGNTGHNFNGTADYKLSPRNTLSSSLLVNVGTGSTTSLADYSELNSTQVLLDQYQRLRDDDADNRMADASLGFRRTVTPQRNELSSEVRLNRVSDATTTTLWRQPVGGGAQTDAEIDRNSGATWQLTGQLDYTRAFGRANKLETGFKGIARWLDRDYNVVKDPTGSGVYVPATDLSNSLSMDETVNAGYVVLSETAGKFELQQGLRAEYATRDFTLTNTGERFPHDYASLFPSGLVNWKFTSSDQLKLSYSRRVRRPGTQELNPFPVFFDLQNVFIGNPRLDPEYTDAIELGYTHSARLGTLQLSPFYRRTTNVIRFIVNTADTVAGREVTSVSFENLDHGTSWGSDLNLQAHAGPFSGFAGGSVFKMVTQGTSGISSLSSNAVSWTARASGTMNLSPRTAFTAQYFYRGPIAIERGRFAGSGQGNFALRQKLIGDKASLTVRLVDAFNTARFRVQAGDDNVVQLTSRRFNSRALFITYQTSFGRPPRLRQRPQDQPQPTAPTPFGG